MYIHICMSAYICMNVCICIYIYINVHVCISRVYAHMYICMSACIYVCVCMNLCLYWVPYHSFIHATRCSHDSYVRHTEEGLLQDFWVPCQWFICVTWLTHACDRSKTHWRRTSTGYFGTLSIKWDTSSWQLGGGSLLLIHDSLFVAPYSWLQ